MLPTLIRNFFCWQACFIWRQYFFLGNLLAVIGLEQPGFCLDNEPPPSNWIDGVQQGKHGVSLNIWTQNGTRNQTAPYLGGMLFEDISHSGDGGIYGELLRNRAFQGSGIQMGELANIPYRSIIKSENPVIAFAPVMDGWTAVGDVRLRLDLLHPLSDSLQVALQVDVLLNATGRVGIQNDGWWGIPVSKQTYETSFYAQADGARFNWTMTEFAVSLQSARESETWCSQTIPIKNRLTPFDYERFETQLVCNAKAPSIHNTFAITFDAKEAAGQTLYFDLMSLFGETYKGRKNGLRKDLAEKLEEMHPKYLRFPGGNNLEGYSIARRWKWWKTIGDLKDRPGRPGDWTYYNTDGLGLLEYLQWCEDMSMEPLLAVYAGFSLEISVFDAGNSTDANEYPMSKMPKVLKEVLDELEYCMGSIDTYWGSQRALHGHPEPFDIKLIEIGNEDFFSHNYPARAKFMYDGLKTLYPNVTYIFSAMNETQEFKVSIPPGGVWDAHIYAPAGHFIRQFDYWDNFQSVPSQSSVLGSLMEYHASVVGVAGVANQHPRIGAAVAEAVYAIGGERNPNTYKLSAFAPLIQNVNAWRGTPYNILFTADPEQTILSASYYQQQLFNAFPGTHTLEVTEQKDSDGFNPLFWVATIHDPKNEIYLKIVNAGNTSQSLNVTLDVAFNSVNGTILMSNENEDMYAYNYFGEDNVIPKAITGLEWFGTQESQTLRHNTGRDFNWTVPAFSISVLQFSLGHGSQSLQLEQVVL